MYIYFHYTPKKLTLKLSLPYLIFVISNVLWELGNAIATKILSGKLLPVIIDKKKKSNFSSTVKIGTNNNLLYMICCENFMDVALLYENLETDVYPSHQPK